MDKKKALEERSKAWNQGYESACKQVRERLDAIEELLSQRINPLESQEYWKPVFTAIRDAKLFALLGEETGNA